MNPSDGELVWRETMRPSLGSRTYFALCLTSLLLAQSGHAQIVSEAQIEYFEQQESKVVHYLDSESGRLYSEMTDTLKRLRREIHQHMVEGYVRNIEKEDLVVLDQILDQIKANLDSTSSLAQQVRNQLDEVSRGQLAWMKTVRELVMRITPELNSVVDERTFSEAYLKISSFNSLLPPTQDQENKEAVLLFQMTDLNAKAKAHEAQLKSQSTGRALDFFTIKHGDFIKTRFYALQDAYRACREPFPPMERHVKAAKNVRANVVEDVTAMWFNLIKIKLYESTVAQAVEIIARYEIAKQQDDLYSQFFAELEGRNRSFSRWFFQLFSPYHAQRVAMESIEYANQLERRYTKEFAGAIDPGDIVMPLFAKYKATFGRNRGQVKLALVSRQKYSDERKRKARFYLDRFSSSMKEDCKQLGGEIAQHDSTLSDNVVTDEVKEEEEFEEFMIRCR